MNKSLFDYHHAMDSEVIDQAYKNCKSSSHNLDVSQITPKLQVTLWPGLQNVQVLNS